MDGVAAAGIRVSGHLHRDVLQGDRIGVGTFTGGGLLGHLVPSGTGGELVGQPYAFDIAVFGQRCDLTSLTRYTYRNLLAGRPVYDDVTVVNGVTIDPDVPPGRTCRADLGLSTTTVPAAPPR